MGRLFGTDGVRGVANVEPMTAETVLLIGRAAAYVCKRFEKKVGRHRIVIGKDTRVSGYMLENALTAGICSMGVDVFLVGPMPTPGIAFITQSMRADAGLVISASHNPYQDNGIKVFSRDGFKLPDAAEDEIEDLITSGRIHNIRPTANDIGRAKRIDDAIGRYIVFCKETFPEELSLDGLRIVLDCANGATYKVAPIIFSELGADVKAIHNDPNGTNINDGCGSQHTAALRGAVLATEAHIGLAFDGDGDRLIVVDERGREISGDQVMAVCAGLYQRKGWLRNNRVVTTVMANFGLLRTLRQMGIEWDSAPVGDRYVLEMMKAKGAVIGGEPSGHMIFLDRHTTGDGIICALQFLTALRESGGTVSMLASIMEPTPQKILNVEVGEKRPLDQVSEIAAAVADAEQQLNGQGRVFVRYSGTQPLCRVMVEGPTEAMTSRLATRIADAVRQALGSRAEV